jgi:NAD(P)-dependent dehydrogenase (short-subunit alcohol dehydrogenase family)
MNNQTSTDEQTAILTRLFGVAGLPILVTGGGRGIGAMMAEALVRAGARVYIVGRNAEVLTKAAASLSQHGHCVAIVGDLSAEQGIESVVAQYAEHETSLHALINNAGTAWGAPIEEYSGERFARVLTVNLLAPFEIAVRFLPALRASASAGNPARIINVGSTDGTLPPRYETYAYSSSKAGLHMLTRHLAYRFRHENIVVNTLAPGLFQTKMTAFRFRTDEGTAEARAEIPVGREGSPDDAGGAALFLCSRASAYITGAVLPVDGGYASLR